MTTIDTYKNIQILIKAGASEKLAKAISDTQIALYDGQLDEIKKTMVTKADLAELKSDLKLEIRDIKIDILKWMLPFLVTIIGIIFLK